MKSTAKSGLVVRFGATAASLLRVDQEGCTKTDFIVRALKATLAEPPQFAQQATTAMRSSAEMLAARKCSHCGEPLPLALAPR